MLILAHAPDMAEILMKNGEWIVSVPIRSILLCAPWLSLRESSPQVTERALCLRGAVMPSKLFQLFVFLNVSPSFSPRG